MAGHIGSSRNLDWNTPHWINEVQVKIFDGGADLDPCSNKSSIITCKSTYRLPNNDGLEDPWDVRGPGTTVYCNPPFGKTYMKPDRNEIISAARMQWLKRNDLAEAKKFTIMRQLNNWISKAVKEMREHRVQTLMLLPAATDTGHWQGGIFDTATSICYIRGRVTFLDVDGEPAEAACPMAMALVGFGTDAGAFEAALTDRGRVFHPRQQNDKKGQFVTKTTEWVGQQ